MDRTGALVSPEDGPLESPAAAAARRESPAILRFLDRHSRWFALLCVIIGSLRIISTYHVFSHTCDETAHIACGMEWLDEKTYRVEAQHPPLARVAAALGLYLAGERSHREVSLKDPVFLQRRGLDILYSHHRYDFNLALARLGVLPFFWVACAVIYLWARRYFTPAIAALAAMLFSLLPPILAHAGLATTDMAVTAFLGASFLSGCIWIEKPTLAHSLWFGVCSALAVLSKFSTVVFLPASVGVTLLWYYASERPTMRQIWKDYRERWRSFSLAVGVSAVAVWAAHHFSIGSLETSRFKKPIPMPEFIDGMADVYMHNATGHHAYMLGMHTMKGFWSYFEVALAVKTPLGFLALLGAGIWAAIRYRDRYRAVWPALCFGAGILLASAPSHINIGIRHILPVYIGLSLVAAVGLAASLESQHLRRWAPFAAVAMTVWLAVASALSHPDYLAYFNELAGSHPENILVDSNLDWGQDVKRLSARLKQLHAPSVAFQPLCEADLEKEHGFPPTTIPDPFTPAPGWNAISVSQWKGFRMALVDSQPGVATWPDHATPVERVGKSIYLYYFPPPAKTR